MFDGNPAFAFEGFQDSVGEGDFALEVYGGELSGGEHLHHLIESVVGGGFDGELFGGVAAGGGEGVDFTGFDVGGEGEHGAEDFAERGAVIAGDPFAEGDEFVAEDGLGVDEAEGVFYGDGGRVVMGAEDDSGEFAGAEGDDEAGAGFDAVLEGEGERVGEGLVEGDGQADVAIAGQCFSLGEDGWQLAAGCRTCRTEPQPNCRASSAGPTKACPQAESPPHKTCCLVDETGKGFLRHGRRSQLSLRVHSA